jgi:O-antigen/teichoic acid export membrane protein
VLLAGMLLAGASGVASAYLYGRGSPGLNSIVLGIGLVITVILDLVLIPRFGALGAAAASTAAYLGTDCVLVGLLLRLSGRARPRDSTAPAQATGVTS